MCNHVIKARARVLRHNLRRRKRVKATRALKVAQAIAREEGEEEEEEEPRENLNDDEEAEQDQGYTRPRVLILCPMRSNALKVRHIDCGVWWVDALTDWIDCLTDWID
jgi:hypothetical protein